MGGAGGSFTTKLSNTNTMHGKNLTSRIKVETYLFPIKHDVIYYPEEEESLLSAMLYTALFH